MAFERMRQRSYQIARARGGSLLRRSDSASGRSYDAQALSEVTSDGASVSEVVQTKTGRGRTTARSPSRAYLRGEPLGLSSQLQVSYHLARPSYGMIPDMQRSGLRRPGIAGFLDDPKRADQQVSARRAHGRYRTARRWRAPRSNQALGGVVAVVDFSWQVRFPFAPVWYRSCAVFNIETEFSG